MNSRTYSTLVVLVAVTIAVSLVRSSGVNAEDRPNEVAGALSSNIQVVTYASGLTGFYDPSSRRLYLYASDVKTPFMTVELEKLGEPLKVITAPQ
jgi:hypothetical protein